MCSYFKAIDQKRKFKKARCANALKCAQSSKVLAKKNLKCLIFSATLSFKIIVVETFSNLIQNEFD